MNFNRTELIKAVTAATKIIARRNPQPILACVKIAFSDLSAELQATDLDTWFKTTLYSGGATGTYGPVCLEAKQLLQVLKSRNDDLVLISAPAVNCILVDGMKVESYPAADYPTLPVVESEHEAWVTMPAKEMQRVIDQAAWAAVSYDQTSVLGAICFKSNEACATDGSRLSLVKPLDIAGKLHLDCLVPADVIIKSLAPLLKPGIKAGTSLRLTPTKAFGSPALAIEGSNWTLITRLVEGQYPKYSELIPAQTGSFVTFKKADMLAALKQIKPFLDKRTNVVAIDPELGELKIGDQKVKVDIAMSPQLEATMVKDVVGWTCNTNYFQQAVESIEADTICLQYAGPCKPLIFRGDRYEHLLMPLWPADEKRRYEAAVKARVQAAKEAETA